MPEQNLKGQYRRAYLDYSRRGKEKCKVPNVVNFVALCILNLVFLNHKNKGLVISACQPTEVDVRNILDYS